MIWLCTLTLYHLKSVLVWPKFREQLVDHCGVSIATYILLLRSRAKVILHGMPNRLLIYNFIQIGDDIIYFSKQHRKIYFHQKADCISLFLPTPRSTGRSLNSHDVSAPIFYTTTKFNCQFMIQFYCWLVK